MSFRFLITVSCLAAAIAAPVAGADNGDPKKARLAELNRLADTRLSAFEFHLAAQHLQEALEVAGKIGPSEEALAHSNLRNTYVEIRKREGTAWSTLALYHSFRASRLAAASGAASTPFGQELVLDYTLDLLEMSDKEFRTDVSASVKPFLEAALSTPTTQPLALSIKLHQAFARFPDGSPEQLRALASCDTLPSPASTGMIPLLADCARAAAAIAVRENKADPADAIRRARQLRAALATPGQDPSRRRWAFERTTAFQLEAETLPDPAAALEASKAAEREAAEFLAPRHGILVDILKTRASIHHRLRDKAAESETKHRLKAYENQLKTPDPNARLQQPKVQRKVTPTYPEAAHIAHFEDSTLLLVSLSTEGVPEIIAVFRKLEFGMNNAAVAGVRQWRFSPLLIDGQALPCMFGITVNFRLDQTSGGRRPAKR